jgi:hypothetical protein
MWERISRCLRVPAPCQDSAGAPDLPAGSQRTLQASRTRRRGLPGDPRAKECLSQSAGMVLEHRPARGTLRVKARSSTFSFSGPSFRLDAASFGVKPARLPRPTHTKDVRNLLAHQAAGCGSLGAGLRREERGGVF